jgi:hypothetical protein
VSDLEKLAALAESAAADQQAYILNDAWDALGPTVNWSAGQARRFGKFMDAEAWLDAAMTFIPEDVADWMVGRFHDSGMCADIFFPMAGNPGIIDQTTAKAATPALALLAAALRARTLIPSSRREGLE